MLELENQRNDAERKEVLVREGKHSKIMEGLWLLVVARDVKGQEEQRSVTYATRKITRET